MTGLMLSLSGLWLALLSPSVSAQISAPAPQPAHLAIIAVLTLLLVILILTGLRRLRPGAPVEQTRRPNSSQSDRKSPVVSMPKEMMDHGLILEAIGERLRQSARQNGDFGVIRLGLDDRLDASDQYARAAVSETIQSIAQTRAARLFLLSADDYLIFFTGEAPDQAVRIAEDFREGIVDLALTAGAKPLTASLGLCTGPAQATTSAQQVIACADAQLQRARQAGGNRVEIRQH